MGATIARKILHTRPLRTVLGRVRPLGRAAQITHSIAGRYGGAVNGCGGIGRKLATDRGRHALVDARHAFGDLA